MGTGCASHPVECPRPEFALQRGRVGGIEIECLPLSPFQSHKVFAFSLLTTLTSECSLRTAYFRFLIAVLFWLVHSPTHVEHVPKFFTAFVCWYFTHGFCRCQGVRCNTVSNSTGRVLLRDTNGRGHGSGSYNLLIIKWRDRAIDVSLGSKEAL